MASFRQETRLHFVLVPLAAQGHLIPMIDMAHLLAGRGVCVSLVITPANATRIKPIIDRVHELDLPIQFTKLAFPGAKFGLPEGCESMELIPRGFFRHFFDAVYSLSEPFELFLKNLDSAPDCIITDMSSAWTGPVVRKFGIPRVIFHGPSCFYISAAHNLEIHKVYDRVSDVFEFVTVPDFPVEVEVNKAQTPGFFNFPGMEDIRKMVLEEQSTADGVVVNTFDDLEKKFIEHYERVIGKKVWTIGPTCLCNKDIDAKSSRGNKEAVDRNKVLTWLDQRDARSVLYSNFGSAAYSNQLQLIEIATGLEASKRPFILVIKKKEIVPEIEKWLSDGFEERVKDRGLILTGWAPQMVILSHPAIGGFMTHCGWNSILEAISLGVPMITWPHFADQFLNEKLVVDVLNIGISIGVKMPNLGSDVVMVRSHDVEKAVLALMEEGNEGKERRDRIRDLAHKAKMAVEEEGSSWKNLADMISYFVEYGRKIED
ncbi:Glycosyltransferase [Rhynchospora pubera]|uniref:Glycosyltransferase n=1 Tax=Rhynchospora pubera TaxID=906938 RepID=A0AAV8HLT1_9POAL|nr:Glycosyltransferase [Rhynchospora pubera]